MTRVDDLAKVANKTEDIASKYHWGKADTLADHFNRHGSAFGAKDPGDYARQASEFLSDSQRKGLPTKIDSSGTIRAYDSKMNTFGSYNTDGTTKTFLKPSAGQNYFSRQSGNIVERKGGGIWTP